MEQAVLDETRLKDILKKAIVELFEERRDLFSEIVGKAIEEASIRKARAIEAVSSIQQESVKKGTNNLTMAEINQEIREVRKAQKNESR